MQSHSIEPHYSQPHSGDTVRQFGRLAEQSPLTGYEPNSCMTAGRNTADTSSRRSSIRSLSTEGHRSSPSAGQNWERGDMILPPQLLSQNGEASDDRLLFYHSSKEGTSERLIQHEGTRCEKNCCMALTRENQVESKSVRRNDSSFKNEEELIDDEREVSRQRDLQQQRPAERPEDEADWKYREMEVRTAAMPDEQRRGIINVAAYELGM